MGSTRPRLIAGDLYRGSFVGWDRGEDIHGKLGEWTLTDSDGRVSRLERFHTGRDRVWYDSRFHGQVNIPEGTKPGRYTISAGAGGWPVSWPVEVVTLPKLSKAANVANPGTVSLQSRLDRQSAMIRLNPGVYELKNTLQLAKASGTVISGPGAILRFGGERKTEWVNLFTGGEYVVFEGVTFDGPGWVRPFQQDACPYLTLINCTFRGGCGLNAPGPGLWCEGVTFEGGAAFLGRDGGLLRRCTFRDSLQDRYLTIWGGDRNLAVVDCHWDRSNRGIVFQANWGHCFEPLLLGVNIRDTVAADGGTEGILMEYDDDVGVSDPLILHYRYSATAGGGPAIQFDAVARNALVMDAKIHGGNGIILWGHSIDRARLHNVSLHGGARIQLGPGTTDTNGTKVLMSGYHPTAPNYEVGHETHTDPDALIVWIRENGVGAGNRFAGQFWLPPGIRACQGPGVEVEGIRAVPNNPVVVE
jgi:hypothetical protein